jgi:hypothetical protein
LAVAGAVLCLSVAAARAQTPAPPAAPAEDKAIAASPNPELIGALASEIGATPKQATGAAGSLFSLAKTRLKPEDWTKVAGAVPGMDDLLKAAPAAAAGTTGAAIPGAAAVGGGTLGGLSSVAGAFQTLGLKPDLALKAVPVLTKYVGKTGGADVAGLLAGALK